METIILLQLLRDIFGPTGDAHYENILHSDFYRTSNLLQKLIFVEGSSTPKAGHGFYS